MEMSHSYFSNKVLSHNTMHGDPTCVEPQSTKIKIKFPENGEFAELLKKKGAF